MRLDGRAPVECSLVQLGFRAHSLFELACGKSIEAIVQSGVVIPIVFQASTYKITAKLRAAEDVNEPCCRVLARLHIGTGSSSMSRFLNVGNLKDHCLKPELSLFPGPGALLCEELRIT